MLQGRGRWAAWAGGQAGGRSQRCSCIGEGGWLERDGGPGSKVPSSPLPWEWGSQRVTAMLAGLGPSHLPVENPQQVPGPLVWAACQHCGRHRAPLARLQHTPHRALPAQGVPGTHKGMELFPILGGGYVQ